MKASAIAGLEANLDKTKIMSNTNDTNFYINGQEIEKVKSYKYLGQLLSFEDREAQELNARKSAGWRSFWALQKFFMGDIPIYHKRRLMNACILPVLTYGCQTWSLTEAGKEELAVVSRNMERKMLKISKADHINNKTIRRKSKIKDVNSSAKQLKWKWAGHVQRLDDDRWPKRIENWKPDGRRKRGRPRMKWQDEIEEHGGMFWRRKAKDREKWKKLELIFTL